MFKNDLAADPKSIEFSSKTFCIYYLIDFMIYCQKMIVQRDYMPIHCARGQSTHYSVRKSIFVVRKVNDMTKKSIDSLQSLQWINYFFGQKQSRSH